MTRIKIEAPSLQPIDIRKIALIDSGGTYHCFYSKSLFRTYEIMNKEVVKSASGTSHIVIRTDSKVVYHAEIEDGTDFLLLETRQGRNI